MARKLTLPDITPLIVDTFSNSTVNSRAGSPDLNQCAIWLYRERGDSDWEGRVNFSVQDMVAAGFTTEEKTSNAIVTDGTPDVLKTE